MIFERAGGTCALKNHYLHRTTNETIHQAGTAPATTQLSAARVAIPPLVDKGRWRNRTPTTSRTTVFKTACRPFSGTFLEKLTDRLQSIAVVISFRTNTTWQVSPPEGALTLIASCQNGKIDYFESLAPQGFQNNIPSRGQN